jgi:hypothetical protein
MLKGRSTVDRLPFPNACGSAEYPTDVSEHMGAAPRHHIGLAESLRVKGGRMIKHLLKCSRLAVLATMVLGCGISVSQANCELFERLSVSLQITGQPGDAFRIIGRCGNTEVVRCRALITAGQTSARCRRSAATEGLEGVMNCPVGVAQGNSDDAAVVAAGCGLRND